MDPMPKRFEYVCANDMRAENPLNLRLREMFDAVERETGGQLSVDIKPWGTAGASKVSLAKLLDNEVAFHPVSGMPLSTRIPIAAMEGLPYAFRDEAEAFRLLDGEFGNLLRREIASLGLVVFPHIWHQGYNQMTSSKGPIRTASDLDGFKLRIAQVPYKLDLFRSLGCDPQQVHYQGVHEALRTGAAWGQETPYLYTEMDGFADVQTHLAVTNHRFASFWMCAHPDSWNALPADVRASLDRNMAKYALLYRQDLLQANEAARVRLQPRLQFSELDTDSFRDRLRESGFYRRWRQEFGEQAWSLLEAQRGRPLG
jgi:TRAP-type transport system periplasmic protein